jgi:hypothetical protein
VEEKFDTGDFPILAVNDRFLGTIKGAAQNFRIKLLCDEFIQIRQRRCNITDEEKKILTMMLTLLHEFFKLG